MPTVKEIIEWLSKAYGQDEHVAVDLWAAEDIKVRAEELGVEITEKEAEEIVEKIHNHIDSEVGISWCVVDTYIEERRRKNDRYKNVRLPYRK
jgi:hypothetical protein